MSKAILVQGLAYGDEAKGATVDFLCRKLPVDLVVRFNGGSQAAHNVVTPEGWHHTFSQFGSGMLANTKTRTHLSRFVLVNPLNMMREADGLEKLPTGYWGGLKVWGRTTVDPKCVIITPFHRQINRLREQLRGFARHGTCGQGVGMAREWHLRYGDQVLLAEDILDSNVLVEKLRFLRHLAQLEFDEALVTLQGEFDLHELAHQYSKWPVTLSTMPEFQTAVFEGAQGVLLDETHGIEPHRTWTDCTFANADALLDEVGMAEADRLRIGCLRTYLTRHGHGPFVAFAGGSRIPENHNEENEWQGEFRSGPMDYELVRRALQVIGGVDCIALSHLDCVDLTYKGWVSEFEAYLGSPVGITAHGPTASHREFTPGWTDAWRTKAEAAGEVVWL